ncbi:MAG: tetratricopeptide repeat protein [Alphaproteobacteria bacterium]|nr:tetratricopeptide repeat protein [Alphaproteobacteria bacterium]
MTGIAARVGSDVTSGYCRRVDGSRLPLSPRTTSLVAAALLLVAQLASSCAVAQQPPGERGDPSRETLRRQQELEDATRGARPTAVTPSRVVEYEEVLARPNDIDLNFAWAQTQVLRGDIKGAANTLERMLLVAPSNPRVRLLYAIVLFRLERLDEAERELAIVRDLPMEASLRSEIDRYRRDIAQARKQTRFTAQLSTAMQYEWNRNASPRSGESSFLDLRFPVASQDRRKSDWQFQNIARIEMTHDLEYQDNHRLTAAATYVRGEQARESQFDFQTGSIEFGGVIDMAPTWLVPNVYARRLRLANQNYGRVEGASLRVEERFSGRFHIYGFGEVETQNYHRTSRSTRAPERSGMQYAAGVGSGWIISPQHRLNLEVGGLLKSAHKDYESYRGPTASLVHTWLLGQGVFLVTTLGGEINLYDEPETVVSVRDRRDRIGRARTTFGVPVGVFIENEAIAQAEPIKDLTMFVSLEGTRARSTITNYSYDTFRVTLGLTKRWDF